MRILLLNPPVPIRAFTNRDLMGGMGIDDAFGKTLPARLLAFAKNQGIQLPVLTLAYAAAILRRAGHHVEVLDQAHQSPDHPETLAAAAATRPEWVVSATSFAYFGAELQYLAKLRDVTGCSRLLFGPTASYFGSEVARRGLCEVIACGEPEVAIAHLAEGTLHPNTPGVALRVGEGDSAQLHDVPPVFLQCLTQLPWPD